MKCIIISSGSFGDYNWARKIIGKHDFIICADGGARHIFNMGITPQIILGDFDSIDMATKRYYLEKEVKFIEFPKDKDFTDTELAVEYAIEHGAKDITLMGVIGSRMDHTLANISILLPLSVRGIHARIVDENNEIVLTRESISISGNPGELLSIIPLSERVEGLCLTGMEYPLDNATIKFGSSIGISNRFLSDNAKVDFESGTILLIKSRD